MGSSMQKMPTYDDDQVNDSFVVDMEHFPHHLLEKDVSQNSKYPKLQRSLSRKGSLRSSEKKSNHKAGTNENYSMETLSRGASHDQFPSTTEKLIRVVTTVGATDNCAPQVHNQITITAGGGGASPAAQSILTGVRRLSFRRPSSPRPRPWTAAVIDPRRILFVFATLSSIGTMLLIYFTLSMNFEANEDQTNVLN